MIELEAQLVDGEVALSVRDTGGWRERDGDERGQGISLMNAFMDQVSVDGGPEGTSVELRRRLGVKQPV